MKYINMLFSKLFGPRILYVVYVTQCHNSFSTGRHSDYCFTNLEKAWQKVKEEEKTEGKYSYHASIVKLEEKDGEYVWKSQIKV